MSDGTENGNSKEAFFLDADDAKSLGNIDYMRTAKTIKKTFPGTAGRQGFETVEVVSSQGKQREGELPPLPKMAASNGNFNNGNLSNGNLSNGNSSNGNLSNGSEPSTETPDRRQADSSMDMFRNMAKDIRKKG
jgi:hypothetical protein